MRAVSIIVPTYNEAENIDLLLERIFAVEGLRQYDLEVVFSDGASTDTTCECIGKWLATNRVRLVRSEINEGLSAAVMAGSRAAKGEFVVVMDADLSHPPETIPELLGPLLAGEVDMTIGSRYVKGGGTPEWPLARKISSVLATVPARLFTDVNDPLAGFLAVHRHRLASMNREVCGFKIGLELLATSEEELRVKEVPIIFRDRCHGTSKMSIQVVLDYFRQMLILAGIDVFPGRPRQTAFLCLAALTVDCTVLTMLLEAGLSPGWAHCLSFLSATILGGGLAIHICRKTVQLIPGRRLAEYVLGFFWVFLLIVLLRSGLVATLTDSEGGLSTASVFITGVLGLAASYAGNICYVLSIGRKRIRSSLIQRFYGLGAVAFVVVLRLVFSGGVDLLPEEQYYAGLLPTTASTSAILAAPLPAIFSYLGTVVVSDTIFGIRVINWLLWFVAAVCVFNLARDMYNRSAAFTCVLLFSILPFFFGTGFFLSSDTVLTCFWCGSLYLLYRALVLGSPSAWLWSGMVLGFGIQADLHLLVVPAGAALYLIFSKEDRRWLQRIELYQALAVMMLTLLPALLVPAVAVTGEAYSGQRWLESLAGGSFPRSYWAVLLLLGPTAVLAGIFVLKQRLLDIPVSYGNPGSNRGKTRLFIFTMFFLTSVLFLLPAVFERGASCAGSVVWMVLLPDISLTMERRGTLQADGFARILAALWWPTIGILMLAYGLLLHLAAL